MLLAVNHLVKTYERGGVPFRAVDDVSFSLEEKEMMAIIGESGSGKVRWAGSSVSLPSPTAARFSSRAAILPICLPATRKSCTGSCKWFSRIPSAPSIPVLPWEKHPGRPAQLSHPAWPGRKGAVTAGSPSVAGSSRPLSPRGQRRGMPARRSTPGIVPASETVNLRRSHQRLGCQHPRRNRQSDQGILPASSDCLPVYYARSAPGPPVMRYYAGHEPGPRRGTGRNRNRLFPSPCRRYQGFAGFPALNPERRAVFFLPRHLASCLGHEKTAHVFT